MGRLSSYSIHTFSVVYEDFGKRFFFLSGNTSDGTNNGTNNGKSTDDATNYASGPSIAPLIHLDVSSVVSFHLPEPLL